MTLTEIMKYGNINVHSVKWVKYHTGNTYSSIQWTPAGSWTSAQIWILGLAGSLCSGNVANFNP